MDDKSLSFDALIHLKYLNSAYNSAITESSNESLKRDLMDLYRDEQNNLYKLYSVMSARGWYQTPPPADQNQVSQVKQQFESESSKVFSGIGTPPGMTGIHTGVGTQPGLGGPVMESGIQSGMRGSQQGGTRPHV